MSIESFKYNSWMLFTIIIINLALYIKPSSSYSLGVELKDIKDRCPSQYRCKEHFDILVQNVPRECSTIASMDVDNLIFNESCSNFRDTTSKLASLECSFINYKAFGGINGTVNNCIIGTSKYMIAVVVISTIPVLLLTAVRLIDFVHVRNFIERLFWTTTFVLMSYASNWLTIGYLTKAEVAMDPPCSAGGWLGLLRVFTKILEIFNWGVFSAFIMSWIVTTFARMDNSRIVVRSMEVRDGFMAIGPHTFILYFVSILARLLAPVRYFLSKYRTEAMIAYVVGNKGSKWISGKVKGDFISSTDETNKVCTELLVNNLVLSVLIFVLDNFTCPGSNSARDGVIAGLVLSIANSIWRTFIIAVRQMDTHALLARRRRLYVDELTPENENTIAAIDGTIEDRRRSMALGTNMISTSRLVMGSKEQIVCNNVDNMGIEERILPAQQVPLVPPGEANGHGEEDKACYC